MVPSVLRRYWLTCLPFGIREREGGGKFCENVSSQRRNLANKLPSKRTSTCRWRSLGLPCHETKASARQRAEDVWTLLAGGGSQRVCALLPKCCWGIRATPASASRQLEMTLPVAAVWGHGYRAINPQHPPPGTAITTAASFTVVLPPVLQFAFGSVRGTRAEARERGGVARELVRAGADGNIPDRKARKKTSAARAVQRCLPACCIPIVGAAPLLKPTPGSSPFPSCFAKAAEGKGQH